jgi:ABC-2 type transport system ATP-binding protein
MRGGDLVCPGRWGVACLCPAAAPAVSDLTFTVRPGVVTGFLGPNGAGKTTTMRMILGLDQPTSGSVTVNGRPPRAHAAPLREVGGMLDPRAVHPARSAYHHLLALAQTNSIRRSRVDEVIDAVGLRAVAWARGPGAGTLPAGSRRALAGASPRLLPVTRAHIPVCPPWRSRAAGTAS